MHRSLKLLKAIKAMTLSLAAIGFLLLLTPALVLAGKFTFIWLIDKTDWRIEDYMCTLPEGCDEFIAERRRLREQKQLGALSKSN
jgi:hypothetical protein